MGTRGALVFVAGDRRVVTYNHFDSYPEVLGRGVAEFIQSMRSDADVASRAAQVIALRCVDPQGEPTLEEEAKYKDLWSADVSSGHDWYATLRELQGRPEAILLAGITPAVDDSWLDDAGHCEWGYVIDFSNELLEVHRGCGIILEAAFDHPDLTQLVLDLPESRGTWLTARSRGTITEERWRLINAQGVAGCDPLERLGGPRWGRWVA